MYLKITAPLQIFALLMFCVFRNSELLLTLPYFMAYLVSVAGLMVFLFLDGVLFVAFLYDRCNGIL